MITPAYRLHGILLLLQLVLVVADNQHHKLSDLSTFISRPDIRAPKVIVTTYNDTLVTPGYIFTEPYSGLMQGPSSSSSQPVERGPHIYDQSGELVWSGADLSNNFNALDFRPLLLNGEFHMSFILQQQLVQHALILNSSYDVVTKVDMSHDFDIHEFLPINNATSILRILRRRVTTDTISTFGGNFTFYDTCATEMDLEGHEIFTFCASDKIGLEESFTPRPGKEGFHGSFALDIFHMNSVEKLPDGDYLISIRHTSAIYKVARATGEIVWRLGGKLSDFEQDFQFSSQHDARLVSCNQSVTVISFLDNAANNMAGYEKTANVSSFKIVALHTTESPMRAELLRQYDRPDGKLTDFRGNGRYYASGGAFVSWSKQSYSSEFAPDGQVVQEVKFLSDRYSTYRGYKADFVGRPSSLPALTTIATASSAGDGGLSSISYVSWNGATEVTTWEFFGSDELDGEYKLLGGAFKLGFETSFISERAWTYTRVSAKDKNGNLLGVSDSVRTLCSICGPDTTSDGRLTSILGPAVRGADFSPTLLILSSLGITVLILLFITARFTGVFSKWIPIPLKRWRGEKYTYSLVEGEQLEETSIP